ncbi:hypothetical protein ACVNIS_09035 [Sphaerotilaceae bacterium SBD11-9]
MDTSRTRLWPFSARASLFCAVATLLGLLLLVAALKVLVGWPSAQSEPALLIGILVLTLLPILLALIDVAILRGAVIEYAGVKLAFSQGRELGASGLKVAANIGVPGKVVTDSGTTEILDALRNTSTHDIAVIDLEDGQAWWETRLLVLLAGAQRRGKPDKVVFVGRDGNKAQRFQGWAPPDALLPLLTNAHPQFGKSLDATRAAGHQLAQAEPAAPPLPRWTPPLGPLAMRHLWMALEPGTDRSNPLFAEQVLQSELGQKVEQAEGSRSISLVRLQELFRPVLNTEAIDMGWPADRQLDAFLASDSPHIAITQNGQYSALVSRAALSNQLLATLLKPEKR